MTNEKMLEKLLCVHTDDMSCADKKALTEVIEALKESIRSKSNKGNGKADLFKAMSNVLKTVPEKNVNLNGAFYNGDWLCVCDSYRIIATTENVDVKMLDPKVKPIDCISIINKMIGDISSETHCEINLPSVNQIKAGMKIANAEYFGSRGRKPKHILMSVEEDMYFNAKLLCEILEAFGEDCKVYRFKEKYRTKPLYFTNKSKTIVAVLLPIGNVDKFSGYKGIGR